jgi:hypothetical protein
VFECADATCSPKTAARNAELSVEGKLFGSLDDGYRCVTYTGVTARYGSVRIQVRSEGFESKSVSVHLTNGCFDATPIYLRRVAAPADTGAVENIDQAARYDGEAEKPQVPTALNVAAPSSATSKPSEAHSVAIPAPRWGLDKETKAAPDGRRISPLKVALYGLSAGAVAAGIVMLVLREDAAVKFNDGPTCGTRRPAKGGGECDQLYNAAVNLGTGIILSSVVAALSFSAAVAIPDRPFGLGIVRACVVTGNPGAICTVRF